MSNPNAADDRDAVSRLRDYLYANGPSPVVDAAAACGLSVSEVSDLMRDGTVAPAGRASSAKRRCVICREQAAVNDLCAECHRGFRDGRRALEPAIGMRARER